MPLFPAFVRKVPKAKRLWDKPESLNWQDLDEAEEPIRALYPVAVETSRSFFLDDYVYAYEGLRFIVQDHAFLEGENRVLVEDIGYYDKKLVLFA